MNITELPIALIDEDTKQPRYQFDEDSLQELMNSIRELGLLSPIKVRPAEGGRYKIVYGNRRYKACKMLGRETIPCLISNVTDEREIYLEQIAENLTREGFSPIEEAEAFNRMLTDPKFSMSVKFLSSKLGKPESYIKKKLDLLQFGPSVRKRIVRGTEITKDCLTEDQLLPIKDLPMEYRDPLALIVARDEMPVSDVKKIVRLFKNKDISDNVKGKLLYKSGPGLLETYFTYEQNKAERARAAEEEKARAAALETAKAEKAAEAAEATKAAETPEARKSEAENASTGEAGNTGESEVSTVGSAGEEGAMEAAAVGSAGAGTGETVAAAGNASSGEASSAGAPMVGSADAYETGYAAVTSLSMSGDAPIVPQLTGLQQLLHVLPQIPALPAETPAVIAELPESKQEAVLEHMDQLIAMLEQQLTAWTTLRKQSASLQKNQN